LEKQFVDHLAGGMVDHAVAERGYRLFMRFEELIDRGANGDYQRRGRLEEAYDRWPTLQRAYAMRSSATASAQLRREPPLPHRGRAGAAQHRTVVAPAVTISRTVRLKCSERWGVYS